MTHIYLIRHGETEENKLQILQGHLPGHLTALGRAQAETLRDRLSQSNTPFDLILSSDLQRTIDTANIVNSALHLPLLPCPLLRERNWGSYTGVSISLAQSTPIPEDAESVSQMFERAKRFLLYVDTHFRGKRILAVGHGLFNRTIQAALLGITIKDTPRFENCEVRPLSFDHLPSSWRLDEQQIVSAD